MRTLLHGGHIVNEGRCFRGSIVIEDECIADIIEGTEAPRGTYDNTLDASGGFVIPGIIDSHVHFRDPGLTQKADIDTESRAAAWGGVTSYFDMPNTVPQTTSIDALAEKLELARQKSHVNYAFFFGATNDNIDEMQRLDPHTVPGVKLFMGSSTGNMLVDRREALQQLFCHCTLPIMAHCEDSDTINANMATAQAQYGDDPDVAHHPEIRSEEACYKSTALAVSLAKTYGAQLHVAHISTAKELQLFGDNDKITAEAVIAHLVFCQDDYQRLGTLIKCNPAIKTPADRDALRRALSTGQIATIGTDHAPHQATDKQGGCRRAASGMPMVQFSLVTMLELADQGVLTMERLVQLMCHNPARLFSLRQRGFLRRGYKADIVIVGRDEPWRVTKECIQSKCGWSPMMGHQYSWRVRQTICNGHTVFRDGQMDNEYRGQQLMFR